MSERPATLVFHEGVRELLVRGNREGSVAYPVTRRASIKDVIEALGPPHTEVGGIVADGREVGFGHLLAPDERLEIRPVAAPCDVLRAAPLRPNPLPRVAFAADANVGRLATLLRALGFDTVYEPGLGDTGLAALAAEEGRIVLSKDRGLLKHARIQHGRLVRVEDPAQQLLEVLRFYGLGPPFKAFSRCPRCNALLVPITKAAVAHRLLPLTRRHYHDFHICPGCDALYWPGSHHDHMLERIERLGRELTI